MDDVLHTRIEDVKEFNVRIVNCLTRIENIKTVGVLIQKSTKQIMSIPWMGRKSVNIIKNYLSSIGLSLNDKPTQVSMKMKWTFYTVGKDGQSYFPKKTGASQVELIDVWTLNIHEALLWNNREDFECLANEYCNAYIVGVVGL